MTLLIGASACIESTAISPRYEHLLFSCLFFVFVIFTTGKVEKERATCCRQTFRVLTVAVSASCVHFQASERVSVTRACSVWGVAARGYTKGKIWTLVRQHYDPPDRNMFYDIPAAGICLPIFLAKNNKSKTVCVRGVFSNSDETSAS